MDKILQKEQCKSSVDSFYAKIRHFKNFLRFYIYSSFDSEFIFKYYILSHKFYFSQNVETDTSGKFFLSTFVSSMPVNLNQQRGTVGVFNNRNIPICEMEMVSLLNKTITNIPSNYIPHERITCDDKDPPWFNKTSSS